MSADKLKRNRLFKNIALVAIALASIVLVIVGALFIHTLFTGPMTTNYVIERGTTAAVAASTIVTGYINFLKFKEEEI